jgi:predicted lipid-binding transport protein (Tim44 family)
MQTMRRDSFTAMFVYGGLTGLLAWGLSALTGTGMAGLYAFSFLGMIAVPLYLMWPEQRRFGRHRHTPADPIHEKRRSRHPSPPGAL